MNAAFLLMSTAALAGADPAPPTPAPAPAAPAVVSGSGCSNCGAPPVYTGGCCEPKMGLLDKLKSRMGGFGKKSCGCAPAPVSCAPAPCSTCSSVANRPNLFDTLKSRMGSKKHCGGHTGCGPTCDTCGATHLMPPTGAPVPPTGTPPKEMPKTDAPKTEAPKEMPKGGSTSSIPQPLPSVSGAGLTGTSPY